MINFNKLEKCDNIFSKFRGLMFSKRRNLLFDLGKAKFFGAIIHTFFVFFSIKVYWLNENEEVIDYRVIRPFQVAVPKGRARYIVEISK